MSRAPIAPWQAKRRTTRFDGAPQGPGHWAALEFDVKIRARLSRAGATPHEAPRRSAVVLTRDVPVQERLVPDGGNRDKAGLEARGRAV